MGGDGQALLNSRKLLENLYRRQRQDASNTTAVDRQNRLQYCAISHEALSQPVCVDLRGNLYNRSAVVQHLLDKKARSLPAQGEGSLIERLKDVRAVVDASSPATDGDEAVGKPFELVCAETGRRSTGGRFPFACNWGCGHVICAAEDADLAAKECPLCEPELDEALSLAKQVWVRLGLEKVAAEEQRAVLSDILRTAKRQRE